MTPAFHHSHGIVFARGWAMKDADAVALTALYRDEVQASFAALDDAAWEQARACLHELSQAQLDARAYRQARVRAIRLEAFNAERRAA